MTPRRTIPCTLTGAAFLLLCALSIADDQSRSQAPPPKASPIPSTSMTKETRMSVIRTLNAELVYIRTAFPMGAKGLKLRDGVVTPSGPELEMMLATFGPSVKPGDQARISNIFFHDKNIVFEINGGPRKKTKWYQRISISGTGGETPIAPSDQDANARGSYVELQFDHHVPDVTAADLKKLLRPVFDFDAKSAIESYLETVPPKVKEAIQNHKVLVGMNREMVVYSKGRAEKKIREKQGDIEFEEWIYGEPPKDVEFVRLVGDEVVQMKTMKIDGERIIRTEKEVDGVPRQTVAADDAKQPGLTGRRPTLRRAGEEDDSDSDPTKGQTTSGPRMGRPQNGPAGGNPNPGGSSPNPPNFQSGT